MMKRLLLLVNPLAGKGHAKDELYTLIDVFTKGGYDVTVHPTQKKGDATDYVRAHACEFDRIVCCGGDGTLSETINGIISQDKRVPLGYIPAGTTNDFASTLGLSRSILQAADTALCGQPFACDIGRFCGRPFVYVASFGIFTEASYATPQRTKNLLGPVAYFLEGIKELSAIQSYRVVLQHDGNELRGDFIFGAFSNSTSIAGFQSRNLMDVVLDDGLFELLLIRMPRSFLELHSLVAALLRQEIDDRYIYYAHSSKIELAAEQPLAWSLDGEFGGRYPRAQIDCIPRAVDLAVPAAPGKTAKLPGGDLPAQPSGKEGGV